MPRIRIWQDLHLFRPDATARYENIDGLFTAIVDWALVEAHLPDMPRVALSILFSVLTRKRIRHGSFHSLVDLQAAIKRIPAEYKVNPKPSAWKVQQRPSSPNSTDCLHHPFEVAEEMEDAEERVGVSTGVGHDFCRLQLRLLLQHNR